MCRSNFYPLRGYHETVLFDLGFPRSAPHWHLSALRRCIWSNLHMQLKSLQAIPIACATLAKRFFY